MVIEILHRIAQTITEYFSECSDSIIKENLVIVFELLDEILDNGRTNGIIGWTTALISRV